MWLPRDLWTTLGGFPEWFESIGEDLYLCCRARLAGYSVQVAGVSGYWHRVGASFGGGKAQDDNKLATTFRRRALSERNKTFVMALLYPAPAMQLILPLHLVLLLLEGTLLSALKCRTAYLSVIYLPVLGTLYRDRTRLRAERVRIQQMRSSSLYTFFSLFKLIPYKLKMLLKHGMPDVR